MSQSESVEVSRSYRKICSSSELNSTQKAVSSLLERELNKKTWDIAHEWLELGKKKSERSCSRSSKK